MPKKGDKLDFANYRPISITPTVSKVLEILLNNQICKYFEENSLFTNCQFDFRNSYSTVDAVVSFIKRSFCELEKGHYVSSRFFDLTKAFDSVSHDILLHKIKFYGFDDVSVKFINSYLSDRYQHVYINDHNKSDFRLIQYGVPQGSILGPVLLFM